MRVRYRIGFLPMAMTLSMATIGLAACAPSGDGAGGQTEMVEEPTDQPSGTPAPDTFAGSAWRATAADGARYVTYLDPNDRYRDFRNGDPWHEGTWRLVDGPEIRELCFSPDGGNGDETCWRPGRMQEDTLIANGPDDRRIELTRAAYRAPETAEEGEASGEQVESGQAE